MSKTSESPFAVNSISLWLIEALLMLPENAKTFFI